MVTELCRRRAEFEVHYCTRSPERTAFRRELAPHAAEGRLYFHRDGGDPAQGLDIRAALREPRPGTHLYYCGPAPLMAAAAEAARHWPAGTVHCEYFTGVPEPAAAEDQPFCMRLAKTGGDYEVRAGETIAEALQRHGVPVRTSCELGYCGTCLTPYLAGDPDHRDQVLEESGRRHYVLICCSRSKSPVLVLDL
jgi:vanillate O-demethylase ferredoxin subunit